MLSTCYCCAILYFLHANVRISMHKKNCILWKIFLIHDLISKLKLLFSKNERKRVFSAGLSSRQLKATLQWIEYLLGATVEL